MLHENVHVPYKKIETNPRIKPSKVIGATEFCSSGQVSNSDDSWFKYKLPYKIPTIDAKSKHDVSLETNTFSVTD